MGSSNRPTKVAEAIKREMSQLILLEIKDTRVKNTVTSVTDVEVTSDLRHAKVFISVFGDSELKKSVMQGLESAKGFIRSEIGKRINLRFAPEIHLKLDDSLEKSQKILSLMNKVKVSEDLEESQEPENLPSEII